MGKNPFLIHFTIDKTNKQSTCTLCNAVLKGWHGGNLEKHFKLYHKDAHSEIRQNEDSDGEPADKRAKKAVIKIEMNEKQLTDACVDLVTTNGHPFSIIEHSGFRAIIDPILKGLGNNITLNRRNITDEVSLRANSMRESIKQELIGKWVHVKADSASRLGRSVLGVNIQYVVDFKMKLKNVGMLELDEKHLGEYLKEQIKKVLLRYGVETKNIVSFTRDRGANIVLVRRILIPVHNHSNLCRFRQES